MAKQTVDVQRVGPYGVMVAGVWCKYGRGVTTADFPVKGQYEVETNVGSKGGTFINKVYEVVGPSLNTNVNTAPLVAGPKVATQHGRPVSDYELAKDKRISRAGVIQAVAHSPALASINISTEDGQQLFTRTAIAIAEVLLEWVGK